MTDSFFGCVGIPNKKIRDIADSRLFFSSFAETVTAAYKASNVEAVAGWGYKSNTNKLCQFAEQQNIPYIALEDGFFRSVGLGVDGHRPLSLIADEVGVYYSAKSESLLERRLNSGPVLAENEEQAAQEVLSLIRQHKLTKYNIATEEMPDWLVYGPDDYWMLVDQTRGDMSIEESTATHSDFDRMVDYALQRKPANRLIVKTHPDVLSGKKKGCISLSRLPKGVRVLTEQVCNWQLFDKLESILVISSQLGFEGLLAGKHVKCFALPFYAGWGLTDDNKQIARRRKDTSLAQLVSETIVNYPVYIDPFSRQRVSAVEGLSILADLKSRTSRLNVPKIYTGIATWKRENFLSYVGKGNVSVEEKKPTLASKLAIEKGRSLFIWAKNINDEILTNMERSGQKCVRVEDGFIRSVGLGTKLHPACSLVFDDTGIYYDATRPSKLQNLLNSIALDEPQRLRAKDLIRLVVENEITKYNTGANVVELSIPADKPVILVAGQVESDFSLLKSLGKIKTNLDLLTTVRNRNPDSFIIYKPHPDVLTGLKPGKINPSQTNRYADLVVETASTTALLKIADEVHINTSLVGFEALLRGKAVFTYGSPFYAGWGLTTDEVDFDKRTNQLSLEELVFGALIEYPSYVDPVSNLLCEPEIVINRLQQNLTYQPSAGMVEALRRVYNNSPFAKILVRWF